MEIIYNFNYYSENSRYFTLYILFIFILVYYFSFYVYQTYFSLSKKICGSKKHWKWQSY